MKLLRSIIPTLLAAALVLIAGYTDAADANTVPAASDLQERMLNEQIDVKPNGIGITSPQHESKSGKSKSAKNGSNNVNVIDKVVAFAFGTVGFIGLANNNIINEEKSIDILTHIVVKPTISRVPLLPLVRMEEQGVVSKPLGRTIIYSWRTYITFEVARVQRRSHFGSALIGVY